MSGSDGRFDVQLLSNQTRSGFDCGDNNLNKYFAAQAGQDQQRGVSTCYIAQERASGQIAGYYTLSACHIYLDTLPQTFTRKLPRYPEVPAARIGRLAVDHRFQGSGLGRALTANAIMRISRSELAVAVVVVDAKDKKVSEFYRRFGFEPFPDQPLFLFAPLNVLKRALPGSR